MVFKENNQIVLITGTSSGFGLKTSIALARQGYLVIATMRNLERKTELIQLAEEYGVIDRLDLLTLDVTNEQQIEDVTEHILKKYGYIDILINNAGYAQGGYIEVLPLDKWREQFETNFFGLVRLTQAILPTMRSRKQGKILNISSISGHIAFPSLAPYASSKFAVEAFSEALRLEMLPYGVYVSVIEPGAYKTQIWDKGLRSYQEESSSFEVEMQRMIQRMEMTAQRAADPVEVVDTILYVVKSRRPKLRYPVGKGVAMTMFLKKIVPWSWFEKSVLQVINKEERSKK